MLFKGHIAGKAFVIDGIFEAADTECLDFEMECSLTNYADESRVCHNILYDVLDSCYSLVRYTEENLVLWKDYLDWQEQLAKLEIYGCKYYKITVDPDSCRLNFWLICKNREHFKSIRKYLSRDMQAFENSYSSDEWEFKFADSDDRDKRKAFKKSVELGRFRGIVCHFDLYTDNFEDNKSEDYLTAVEINEIEALDAPFDNPYIAVASYDLNQTDSDTVLEKNLEGSELLDYIYQTVLDRYEENGFLALSAVGQMALIRRFRGAIRQLEKDECHSPNLAAWLFNINQARFPDPDDYPEISEWLNPNIENNDNQKEAVMKMLAAPDLCLIQGPPGTGKTTVIAEAIFQLVRNGNRVLVSSQSNDAVDNALERLINTPEIRAVRLGRKSQRRKKSDEGINKFAEDNVIKNYYAALSGKVSETWLDRWSRLENSIIECDKDIFDVRFNDKDITELLERYRKLEERLAAERSFLAENKMSLENAREYNSQLSAERIQLSRFKDFVKTGEANGFFLSKEQLGFIVNNVNPVIRNAFSYGVKIFDSEIDIEKISEKACASIIEIIHYNVKALNVLIGKIENAGGQSNDQNMQIKLLQARLDDICSQLYKAMDDEDNVLETELKNQRKNIKLQIDKLSVDGGGIVLSDKEKQVLSGELINDVCGDKGNTVTPVLQQVISDWQKALDTSLKNIDSYMASRAEKDERKIVEASESAEGRIKVFSEELNSLANHINAKRSLVSTLAEKYHVETEGIDEIIYAIQQVQAESRGELERHRRLRDDWGRTLKEFKEHLTAPDVYLYDGSYYKKTYINACNVVGISCTDNMKELDDIYNHFDVVIIDEVSKATPPELLIPLMKARKAILVGDHRQLPPMFKEQERSYSEICEQIENNLTDDDENSARIRGLMTKDNFRRFNDMVTSSLFKSYFENADDSIKHSLLIQYRMHSDISCVINRFYENRLRNGNSPAVEAVEKNHGLTINDVTGKGVIVPMNHAYWVDSSNLPSGDAAYESFIGKSTSACNFFEVHIIIELLKKMADDYRKTYSSAKKPVQKTVGVISFYQMQVNELRSTLREACRTFDFSPLEIDINTVDRFQGREKNIIITSLVRNNKSSRAGSHVIAFERINVAFSRAQELLVIVGAKHMYEELNVRLPNMNRSGFKTVPVYKNIIDELKRKACFRSGSKLITPETEELIKKKIKESEASK